MLVQVQASLPITLIYGDWELSFDFCCVLAITIFETMTNTHYIEVSLELY